VTVELARSLACGGVVLPKWLDGNRKATFDGLGGRSPKVAYASSSEDLFSHAARSASGLHVGNIPNDLAGVRQAIDRPIQIVLEPSVTLPCYLAA
jgi:hypothetical protein